MRDIKRHTLYNKSLYLTDGEFRRCSIYDLLHERSKGILGKSAKNLDIAVVWSFRITWQFLVMNKELLNHENFRTQESTVHLVRNKSQRGRRLLRAGPIRRPAWMSGGGVTRQVWFCTWWTGRTACLFWTFLTVLVPRQEGISSCCNMQ